MGFFKEFKEFAVKGNMIDMAVGIIIGTAFNKIIDVLVKQVFMPPLSLMTDGIHFKDKKLTLRHAITNADGEIASPEVAIGYGAFLEALLDFFIIGLTVFVVVKFMNRLKKKLQDTQDKTVETPKEIQLLSNMEMLLEEQNALLKQGKK